MKVPADVKTVRLTWAAAPAIVFIGKAFGGSRPFRCQLFELPDS